jgi:hypothetical protein
MWNILILRERDFYFEFAIDGLQLCGDGSRNDYYYKVG